MLIYETEGFLEVESKEIKQLYRSTGSVSLHDKGDETYEIQSVLCDYLDNSEQRCRVAFYSKSLKKALIFAVKGPEKKSSWKHGQETLTLLGFQLEEVNLKLSPAMVEVVLQDVPGLLNPAEARKQRAEKAQLLADFQEIFDKAPDSVEGKRAALKLNAEKWLNNRTEELRLLLEELLVSGEAVRSDLDALASQVKDLTVRLETASALAEAERNQREMTESITAAAEKRIKELEEVLVDVETKSSDSLKQKKKIVKLQSHIKALDGDLTTVEAELAKEREKQEQFISDINAAHEQTSLLENELKDAQATLVKNQTLLTEEQTERAQLTESLKASELRIKTLDKELISAEKEAAQCDEVARASEDAQAQLAETKQTLQETLDLNNALEEKLAAAFELNEVLRENLQETEKDVSDKTRDKEQIVALTEQGKQLDRKLKSLRDEYDQECSIRKGLEKCVADDNKRIFELETSLAKAMDNTAGLSVSDNRSDGVAREIDSLKSELREQNQRFNEERKCREELESEIDEAHKLIDSMEKMIREKDAASNSNENQKVQELLKQVEKVEAQLEQERAEQKKLARAVVVAEKKISEQEELLAQGQAEQDERKTRETVEVETIAQARAKSSKPLPHELRPAPKKGVLFRPDWDLEGLPCQDSGQVFKAWESVFNVQISMEGYPSQYCMAFMVVLRLKKQKRLYMLYRLKDTKHTLVCVPDKTPKDEDSLKKTIKEGLKFLRMSGFELEEMSAEHIDSTLTPYFLEA